MRRKGVLKNRKKCGAILFVLMLGILLLAMPQETRADDGKQVDIVFTHDIHSYLESYLVEGESGEIEVGGFPRLATLIQQKKQQNPDTLVLDAGDFSMGTLFHTQYTSEAIEYRMLGELGFDGTTFGNHEFDFGSDGLAAMFQTAGERSDTLPPVLVCNIDWTAQDDATQKIYAAVKKCGVADYIILEKGDVKIAVTGVLGKDALACAPTCELTVLDPIESVKKTVAEIKEKENPDMIVCVSHSGTWEDEKQSEDELLAKAVPDLDVIVSGHTHTTLEEPIIVGNTCIASCGAYGRNTGTITLTNTKEGQWEVEDYQLVSMDESIEEDPEILQELDAFREGIDTDYLSQFGYTTNQVLAENQVEFEPISQLETDHTEHALGNIMADAYRYAARSYGVDAADTDIAIVPAGTIRGTYLEGQVTVKDVFNSFSLGDGPDGIAGYPLIKIYLTGEELKTAAEVDASISDMMVTARLYMSGLSFAYNPHRMILDRVTDISLNPDLMEDTAVSLEDDKLYSVVVDLYSGRMLSAVSAKSYGILKIVPKDKNGNPVENFEDAIVYDENGKEMKAWVAIASYFESFPDEETGISQVPAYYESMHNRKAVQDESSLGKILEKPGKYAKMLYGIGAAVILVLVVLVFVIIKVVKRHRKKKKMMREG